MKLILIVLPFLFLLTSCKNERVIEEEKFVKIYADLVIANDTLAADTTKMFDEFRDEIFKRYSISEEQYKSTIEFYNKEPQRWQSFFEKVLTYVEDLQKKRKI